MNSKAFKVYNIRTRKVEENLHIKFLEDKPIIIGDGPKWLVDIDVLTKSMNYVPVIAGTISNDLVDGSLFDSSLKNDSNDETQPSSNAGKKDDEGICKESGIADQEKSENSTPNINTVGPSINTASANFKTGSLNINTVSPTVITTRSNRSQNVSNMFSWEGSVPLEATHADVFVDETEIDMSNLTTSYQVPTSPNTRIHKDHSLAHVIGDIQTSVQTRGMTKNTDKHGFVEAMQEELLQFKLQKVWILVDLPKVFAPVVRIEAVRMFLSYASFMGFMVYQMDVKSDFLYGTIEEEFYVCQPPGFEDPDYLNKVYK
ncbi:putative ribonuclease H-like domain-containing protein, partial [Tanacetum coccineum]